MGLASRHSRWGEMPVWFISAVDLRSNVGVMDVMVELVIQGESFNDRYALQRGCRWLRR